MFDHSKQLWCTHFSCVRCSCRNQNVVQYFKHRYSVLTNLNATYPVSCLSIIFKVKSSSQLLELNIFRSFLNGIQHKLHHLHCPSDDLSSDWYWHLDPGICTGFSGEPVCGLVGDLPCKEALSDMFVGVESGCCGCSCPAQCTFFPEIPGWRPRLGVWLSSMQADALPIKCEHVRVHLPYLSDEHGPLPCCHKAFCFPENKN